MSPNIPSDGVLVRNARLAVERELSKKRTLNQPIARFDPKTKRVYMEYADGTTTPVEGATWRGRYGERRRQKT